MFRFACGVENDDKFIVMGGHHSSAGRTVAEFSETGEVSYLPNMIRARYMHACSKFVNSKGQTVSLYYLLFREGYKVRN